MEWNNYCVTNAGVEVLKKAIGGKKVTITAAKSGTDTVAESELKEQSALSGTVRNVTIANATNQSEGYRVTLRVTNTGVKTSYIFKQLGLFATAEDESEVLFAILQSENGETVPDESELYTYDVSLIIAISDTSNITVNVDKTSYVTEEELDEHKTDTSNPHGVTKTQVGLGNVDNTSDENKPISSATQTALNGKSDKTHKHKTADISDMPTALPADGGNSATVNGHTVASDVPANAKFTDTQYSPFVKSGAEAKAGLVPTPSTTAGTSKYLCENGTWAVPPDTKYSTATTTSAGLLSATDKSKLDGIEAGADKYKLPVASETLGGVKTGPSVVVNSDGTMSVVKDSHYHSALEAIDVTGKTIDLNTLNLSDAPGQIKHYVEKTAGGSANITNAPQSGMFLMIARNIRWASSTDYITEQVFVSVTTKKEYSRWCTSGAWSAWVEHNYTNTWRGIQNNLTSDSTTESLSAAQGKALKTLVDGKASSGHTHSYAGSSSVGGVATSANKINTDAGSATQPVYFKDGIPKATTYTLGKSVPASAVFTDTWKALVGSSTSAAGTAGYAPAPAKGTSNRYLRCDGTWVVPPDTINTIVIKQGSALGQEIDISSRKQAYIVFYKITSSGALSSFIQPFIIEDTTPATAISHTTICSGSNLTVGYSLTTDGKITFEGNGGYSYKILLFD